MTEKELFRNSSAVYDLVMRRAILDKGSSASLATATLDKKDTGERRKTAL
jgi:hypothetical protein